jgi:formate dehydrogenase subunit gamma
MATGLQLNTNTTQKGKASKEPIPQLAPPARESAHTATGIVHSKVLRFAKSERYLHWAIAGPFLLCTTTGMILVLFYNPDPTRHFRPFLAVLHRLSGAALITLPMLATYKGRGEVSIHLHNIRQAWVWAWDDFKWLALMGLAAISDKIQLPEQGKFNAAEKLNFMMLMTTYPLYVVTGLLMWFTHLAVLSWILHIMMAIFSAPLMIGHLYMALINSSTRPGLDGMISGHVDRHWAKHHYGRWYKEHHATSKHSLAEKEL